MVKNIANISANLQRRHIIHIEMWDPRRNYLDAMLDATK